MAALTPQEKAERTYNFTADFFDDPALGFWDRCGRRTVGLLGLEPGMRVLDVCCGTGASALPAAKAVGNGGRVIGVDLSENLLELAQQKAKALQLGTTILRAGLYGMEGGARHAGTGMGDGF